MSISMINLRSQKAWTSLLTAVLLVAVNSSLGAKSLAAEDTRLSATIIGSNESPQRNHALTSVPGQRVAGDISKQNRSKDSLAHKSIAPSKFGAPVLVRQRFALTDQRASYLSFCSTRARGRAPPASA